MEMEDNKGNNTISPYHQSTSDNTTGTYIIVIVTESAGSLPSEYWTEFEQNLCHSAYFFSTICLVIYIPGY